jgi:hypothetical protein
LLAHFGLVVAFTERDLRVSFLALSNLIVIKLHPKPRPAARKRAVSNAVFMLPY